MAFILRYSTKYKKNKLFIEMKKPRGCAVLFIERTFIYLFIYFMAQSGLCSHTQRRLLFSGGEKKNARLILEIMQILDAFGNKVGGEKNGDWCSTIRNKGVVGKGRTVAPQERGVTAGSLRPYYKVFRQALAH